MRCLLILAAAVGLALADGGMVVPPGEEIFEYGQVAVIKHFDGVEELSIATRFHTTSSFAWIVPLPSRPEVDSFGLGLLQTLKEHCRPLYRGGGMGCGCGAAEPGYLGGGERGAEEVGSGIIGNWEWRLFRATEADTLTGFLEDRGYQLPDGTTPALEHYIDKDWNWFLVAQVIDSLVPYYISHVGIRLTFESDSPVYPLYISRISSRSWTDVVLYVLTEHRQFYDEARLRFSGRVDTQTFPEHLGFVQKECHLTKLYRDFPLEEMEDIYLSQAPDDTEYRAIDYYGARDGTTGMFAMLCIVLVLRGRKRRRRS